MGSHFIFEYVQFRGRNINSSVIPGGLVMRGYVITHNGIRKKESSVLCEKSSVFVHKNMNVAVVPTPYVYLFILRGIWES